MTLHPIRLVDRVLDEYRHHLTTEFRARDPELRAALEQALLGDPLFLAQEPFFQAHRPFKDGARWDALGLATELSDVMCKRAKSDHTYLHQSQAIEHLLGPQASPLVVTTGTGSGKTECFLVPAIQNAIDDAVRFQKRAGLTAILVYPMNALANDQEERIQGYLHDSGHTYIKVARYDRSTPEADRADLRKRPPHILLTNYMMLEYLLVRPADREALFANHRCRFVVLDEVHTYRGTLGSNIALLVRRLGAHLRRAKHDFLPDATDDTKRFPTLVHIGTSATIKSVDEQGRSPEQVKQIRDQAVQGFFAKLTGVTPASICVLGEELRDLEVPPEAAWTPEPIAVTPPDVNDSEAVRNAVAVMGGRPAETALEAAARGAAALWTLNDLLARKPLSLPQLAEAVQELVPDRRQTSRDAVEAELRTALVAGAALPDGCPGALRLRTHRLLRGGWSFHRCVDRTCGQLYATESGECDACTLKTAPLYLCRVCGAHALRFCGDSKDPTKTELEPSGDHSADGEWLFYELDAESADGEDEDDGEGSGDPANPTHKTQMKKRPVVAGSFDPTSCAFSTDPAQYAVRGTLAPARNSCLACGATAGAGSVLTPVALGTSAAVRVVTESVVEGLTVENVGRPEHDGKERVLIFADSRQDAAHQARFITYAGRYDRMRRRLYRLLADAKQPLPLSKVTDELIRRAAVARDNPLLKKGVKAEFLSQEDRERGTRWEEAPLLDDLAVSAGFRGTVLNLGLVGVRYDKLEPFVLEEGTAISTALGITPEQLLHICRCLLDTMRARRALSCEQLVYHPRSKDAPSSHAFADWERRVKEPSGFACDTDGMPVGSLDRAEVPNGITPNNSWKRSKTGGRPPVLQKLFTRLLAAYGGKTPVEADLKGVLEFLTGPGFVTASKLHGQWGTRMLLQVDAKRILLEVPKDEDRRRCQVCNLRTPWAPLGAPCPACHGKLALWPAAAVQASRYFQRIVRADRPPLVAAEHTAQVTGTERLELEEEFKGKPEKSLLNVLACSPTLEMGIDVGGLDAIVLRNVPPRPDNYAQRGGRAGRRTRVGVVLGYARRTPHDGYFFDHPAEMIAGEVPAPSVNPANRDAIVRHLNAIALGATEPGLAGRMDMYINIAGDPNEAMIDALIQGFEQQRDHAIDVALDAWGTDVLGPANLVDREALRSLLKEQTGRIRDLFERVQVQIKKLGEQIDLLKQFGTHQAQAINANRLRRRLLGMSDDDKKKDGGEADDRGGGHPMRRFAEHGLLPGYEFPSEPATLRLLGDAHEEEPVSVARRFGLAQYQPEAPAHARGHKWKVIGLDLASPWNPRTDEPTWRYVLCPTCELRYTAQRPACPRCNTATAGQDLPSFDWGGFLAVRDDTPVLEEEDRFAARNLLRIHPQWTGTVKQRNALPTGWRTELRAGEEIRWLNEARPPSREEVSRGAPVLRNPLGDDPGARGFPLCPACGRLLSLEDPSAPPKDGAKKGRPKPRSKSDADPFGHAKNCSRSGEPPITHALSASSLATTYRILAALPPDLSDDDYKTWGESLGHALRTGIRQLYMLDGSELEFVLEGPWARPSGEESQRVGCLTFIDGAVGGSGFLELVAAQLDLVAKKTLEHLVHDRCETACYRCLMTYTNQRIHEHLDWQRVVQDLEQLAAAPPAARSLKLGDDDDPKPWLEAFAAGVGSPLELKFKKLLEELGIPVEPQVPVGPEPNRPISQADFVVKGQRVAIYVDGAAFHKGDRLRRDRAIRKKLAAGSTPWGVVELRADHLRDPQLVLQRLAEVGVGPTASPKLALPVTEPGRWKLVVERLVGTPFGHPNAAAGVSAAWRPKGSTSTAVGATLLLAVRTAAAPMPKDFDGSKYSPKSLAGLGHHLIRVLDLTERLLEVGLVPDGRVQLAKESAQLIEPFLTKVLGLVETKAVLDKMHDYEHVKKTPQHIGLNMLLDVLRKQGRSPFDAAVPGPDMKRSDAWKGFDALTNALRDICEERLGTAHKSPEYSAEEARELAWRAIAVVVSSVERNGPALVEALKQAGATAESRCPRCGGDGQPVEIEVSPGHREFFCDHCRPR